MVSAFSCMSSPPDLSPRQWGDRARAAAPDHDGAHPRVAVWQGSADTTVAPANARESVDQFADLAGVAATPTDTTTLEETSPGHWELGC